MLEEAFLRDIWNNPDDDAVRLIYADWLMEQDQLERRDRGEFIRVQCELARWEGDFRSWSEWAELAPRVPALRKRERQLLAKYGKTWGQPLRGLVKKYIFRRGFIETIRMPAGDFVKRAEEVLRLAPIQHVCFPHFPHGGGPRTPSACWSRLRGLSLSGHYPTVQELPWLHSRHLTHLTTLTFNRCRFPPGALETLAAWPRLAQLEFLGLQVCFLDGVGLRALAHSPHWNPQCRLDLNGTHLFLAPDVLTDVVQDRHQAQLLRMALAMLRAPGQKPHPCPVRLLLDQLARQPEKAASLLNKALADSSREVRAAAATFVACLREEGLACLPALLLRLHDGERSVRGSAAAALGDLIPHLPPEVQRDLCRFANPLPEPRHLLQSLLRREDLVSVPVRRALVARCERRLAAHARQGGVGAPPLCSAFAPAEEFTHRVITTMEEHAVAAGKPQNALRARPQECVWMLARLFEILHPVSAPE